MSTTKVLLGISGAHSVIDSYIADKLDELYATGDFVFYYVDSRVADLLVASKDEVDFVVPGISSPGVTAVKMMLEAASVLIPEYTVVCSARDEAMINLAMSTTATFVSVAPGTTRVAVPPTTPPPTPIPAAIAPATRTRRVVRSHHAPRPEPPATSEGEEKMSKTRLSGIIALSALVVFIVTVATIKLVAQMSDESSFVNGEVRELYAVTFTGTDVLIVAKSKADPNHGILWRVPREFVFTTTTNLPYGHGQFVMQRRNGEVFRKFVYNPR